MAWHSQVAQLNLEFLVWEILMIVSLWCAVLFFENFMLETLVGRSYNYLWLSYSKEKIGIRRSNSFSYLFPFFTGIISTPVWRLCRKRIFACYPMKTSRYTIINHSHNQAKSLCFLLLKYQRLDFSYK